MRDTPRPKKIPPPPSDRVTVYRRPKGRRRALQVRCAHCLGMFWVTVIGEPDKCCRDCARAGHVQSAKFFDECPTCVDQTTKSKLAAETPRSISIGGFEKISRIEKI